MTYPSAPRLERSRVTGSEAAYPCQVGAPRAEQHPSLSERSERFGRGGPREARAGGGQPLFLCSGLHLEPRKPPLPQSSVTALVSDTLPAVIVTRGEVIEIPPPSMTTSLAPHLSVIDWIPIQPFAN
jgi:hypothetical protein